MKPVDETLVCDHSNDSYQAVCSSGTTLSKMILTSNSVNEILLSDQSWQQRLLCSAKWFLSLKMKPLHLSIQIKETEGHLHVLLVFRFFISET